MISLYKPKPIFKETVTFRRSRSRRDTKKHIASLCAMRSLFLAFCCVSVTASSEYYGSCPSGEGAGCEAEQSDTFAPRPGASLTEYLNPLIFGNETFVQQIGETLHHQKLMVIHDAFIPEFAEYVWRDLDAVEKWEYHDDYTEPGYICRKHNVYEMANYTKVMNETFAMFDHPTTREFVAHITGRDVSGPLSGSSSNYMAGDYCMPHSDDGHGRTVSFVWHLSKNWKPGMFLSHLFQLSTTTF